ncbi:PIN domain-containing protein [Blastomonas sp. UPD001]|uniref:PIN domain-containing protein n=1 Tax=Blastomonas sp. UPD001 TaxID=2217673 RepID=UPI000E357A1A|nr:PIN domain-containing protein [Blastomonas sp. UPD001]
MNSILTTPREAETLLAHLFTEGSEAQVKVSENKAFGAQGWLNLGSITLNPGGDKVSHMLTAVRRGGFEWALPSSENVDAQLVELMGLKEADRKNGKLRRAMDAMGGIAVRLGLRYPRLDPFALEGMPYRRSTTVVADTSAVIQGGLDFVARHLHPAARVKVPAIVQMEIVNFAERFLSTRRAAKIRPLDILIDHMLSQGGQRVLLRLELNTDTEIERNFLLGDPLRSAFMKDADPELTDLNLSVRIKAYADRLILESARQHQAQSNLGHKVQLLTSDQGLARMALAEGIVPTYFNSVVASDLFGRRLTGINLDPFSGKLRECSLASVLWELATAFGGVRLESTASDRHIEVAAFGEGLSWSPVQSHGDLLWCDHHGCVALKDPAIPANVAGIAALSAAPKTTSSSEAPDSSEQARERAAKGAARTARSGAKTADVKAHKAQQPVASGATRPQRFNVATFFTVLDGLDVEQSLPEEAVLKLAGAKNRAGIDDYRRFLLSGGYVVVDGDTWNATPAGSALAIALRNEDNKSAFEALQSATSFADFAANVAAVPVGSTIPPGIFERAFKTYRTLGEITLICAPIHQEGLYPTPSTPTAEAFAPLALAHFKALDTGDELVSTGAWLERLIRDEGIHPEIARARLSDASAAGLLRRSTEGSTTDVRNDRHILQVLRARGGHPVIDTVHLYRGDYLIPGKASTSLRILEAAR